MIKRRLIPIAVGLVILIVSASLIAARSRNAAPQASPKAHSRPTPLLIAGPGRVEPSSEDIKLGSELSGKLKAVYVEEGDGIRRGQVLAELENDDYRAQVASAEADVIAMEATLR